MKNLRVLWATAVVAFLTTAPFIALGHPDNWVASYRQTVIVHEGGSRYTNHPNDPGGPTKYGVTIHDVRKYINPKATARDVQRLTEAQARGIFKPRYWDAVQGDRLPRGLDFSVFDYGVNAGIGRAGRDLRRVLGLPDDTYVIDQDVLDALERRDIAQVIRELNDRRLRFQLGLGGKYRVFYKGWKRRILAVRQTSLDMHSGVFKGAVREDMEALGPGKAYGPQGEEIR